MRMQMDVHTYIHLKMADKAGKPVGFNTLQSLYVKPKILSDMFNMQPP